MSTRKSRQARKWRDKEVYFRLLRKEVRQYHRKESGWHHVYSQEDGVTYPIHWFNDGEAGSVQLIHKGRKP